MTRILSLFNLAIYFASVWIRIVKLPKFPNFNYIFNVRSIILHFSDMGFTSRASYVYFHDLPAACAVVTVNVKYETKQISFDFLDVFYATMVSLFEYLLRNQIHQDTIPVIFVANTSELIRKLVFVVCRVRNGVTGSLIQETFPSH